ncbi:MAG: DUF2630 family protein [Acidimicrobiales bacterium]
MDDHEVLVRIRSLVDEEHRLESSGDADGIAPENEEKLRLVQVALDQCWDLLRQRRARRSAGLDPDAADVRPASTVEGYRQ